MAEIPQDSLTLPESVSLLDNVTCTYNGIYTKRSAIAHKGSYVKYELLQSREVSDSYLLNSIVVIIRAGSIWHAADMCGNTTQCLHAFTKHGIYGRHNK